MKAPPTLDRTAASLAGGMGRVPRVPRAAVRWKQDQAVGADSGSAGSRSVAAVNTQGFCMMVAKGCLSLGSGTLTAVSSGVQADEETEHRADGALPARWGWWGCRQRGEAI